MSQLAQDLRFAARMLAKHPAFTAIALATLALGIGANAAIFGLLDQVMLRRLPVAEPQRLVVLNGPGPYSGSTEQSGELVPFSHPMFEGLRDQSTVFSGVLAHWRTPIHLTVGGLTESVAGDLVSGSYFATLGLQPSHGRLFSLEDDRTPGGHPLVVLSHGFWTRRFGADPKVVGQTVGVNGHSMTIVGVGPRGFFGVEVGNSVDVFVPVAMQPQVKPTWPRALGDWRARWLILMARLEDGVSLESAQAGANLLYARLLEEDFAHLTTTSARFRQRFLEKKLELLPGARGSSDLRAQTRTPLLVLMGMVGLVLLIACANVANLLLARATSRQKEIALRLALGASRGRLVRQLLVESLLLSVLGGLLGLVVAGWTGRVLLDMLPDAGAARALSAEPDWRVAGFALALALVTGVVFGLVPALQSTRPELAPTLKGEAGSLAGGSASFRFRRGLVAAQVALSLLLLVGAGLFTRSLMNLRRLDPGFEPSRLLTFSVDPSRNGYTLARRVALLRQLRDEIAAEPGVSSVSLGQEPLLTDSHSSYTIAVEGYQAKEDENMNPDFNAVAPGFFATLGIPLLAGRDLSDSDLLESPKVAVVNETFARYFFKDQEPIGRRFGLGRGSDQLDYTIVGLVRDGKAGSLREEPLRFVYTPFTQSRNLGGVTFYVRAAGPAPAALGGQMRTLTARVDPGLPITELKTMRAQISESLFVERTVAGLSATFGLLATLLAAIGLYGVMSFAVSQRTREIGIRVALGAERGTVLALVMREVAVLWAIGVVVGLPSGYGVARLVESQLFGLKAHDPLTFGVATLTLLLAALAAGYVPAARAARVDPLVALRYE